MISIVASTNLYPDANNPLQVQPPIASQIGSKFSVRFSFPSSTANSVAPYGIASSGLNYKQFIGLAFPPSVGTSDLIFSLQTTQFACELTDGTNTYKMTAVASVASPVISSLTAENNVAYCRLDEASSLVPLKTGLNVVYKLTITLTNLKIASTSFLRSLTLFTSTSNNPEKIIIDSIPVLGNVALYGDYTSMTSKPLDLVDSSVTITNGPSTTTVLPYNTFDVTLQLKINSYISAADHMIVFKYPTNTVVAATSISSVDFKSNDISYTALQGNLNVKAFGSDGIYLDGLTEDLTPNKQIKITLKGWKALDSNIGNNSALQVIVYYKNTYSVLSYVTKNIFIVQKDTMTLSANHPEFWDIYRGGAWPISFNFSVTNYVANGGWVVIQHTNWAEYTSSAGNKLTFVASTCDFSGNDYNLLDNSFGKRPNCYPLRTIDLSYTAPNGSGIFFFLPNIQANKTYKLNVWAFFDVCGGSSDDSMNVVYGTTSYTVPKFTVTVYKTINSAQTNENRFSVMSSGVTQNILAQSSSIDFTGKCWNHLMFDTTAADGNHFSAAYISKHTLTVAADSTKRGILNYREVYDWLAFSVTVDTHTSLTAGTWAAIPKTTVLRSQYDNSKFLYSSTNALGGSFFAVGFNIGKVSIANDSMSYKTALPTLYPSANTFTHPPGKWYWQFPSTWFTAGNGYKGANPTCYASWAIGQGNDAATSTQLLATLTSGKLDMAAAGKNYFGAAVSTGNATLDAGLTLLPPNNNLSGSANIFRLVSTYHDGTTANWRIMDYTKIAIVDATNAKVMALYSSCVKWVGTPPIITSLYTNIDIQIKWNYIGTGGDTNGVGSTISNIRLIKLFPETGVINEFSKNNSSNKGTVNPFVSHTIYTNTGSDSVCLIELSGSVMMNLKDSSSNTLVLWIFWGTLLESDYNDLASNYPVAPLSPYVQSYGLQNGQSIDMSNPLMTKGTGAGYTPIFSQFMQNNLSASLNADATAVLNFKASSSYLWFMGSAVYITSVSTNLTGSTETSFFIPYYCPRFIDTYKSSSAKLGGAHLFPLILSTWVNMRSHSQVYSLGNWIVYDESSLTTANEKTLKLLSNKYISGSKQDVMKTSAVLGTAATVQKATLKWTPYSSTTSTLYVFNGVLTGANTNDITCTGHSLFLNTSISFEPNVTTSFVAGYTGTLASINSGSNFYIFGKIFNKAIYYGLGSASAPTTANMAKLISTTITSANYYSGVKRPSLESFIVNGNLQLTDQIAYACAAVNNDKNEGLSNYIYNSSTPTDNYFFVDFTRNPTAINYSNPIVGWDKQELYKNDVAGNFKVSITPPNANQMQIGAQFSLKTNGSVINNLSFCGIVSTKGGIANQCDIISSTITCSAPAADFTYNICCYNVQLADTISLSSLTTYYSLDSTKTGISSYVSSDLYNASNQISLSTNPYSFITNQSNGSDILSKSNANIASITYSISNQESGIGKVVINVFLPRDPVRDMKLSINGDLSALFIPGLTPRCIASFSKDSIFGTNSDQGDILIDTCSLNTNSKATTPIVVTTKKIIYKCGLSFNRNLFITLWPVNIVNFYNGTQNKNFKINMNLNTGEAIAKNDVSFDVTSSGIVNQTKSKPFLNSIWDTLCKVTNITPKIPGEIADYTFEFDLETGVSSSMGSPNELIIFFPYQQYGAYLTDLNCYYKSEKVNCSFSDEGVLNIRFANNLSVNTKVQILITGIRNPAYDSDIVFACAINQTSFSTGERTNLITGSGKLIGGINTNTVTQNGNLRFLYIDTPVSNSNPRDTSTHKFRISFDTAVNLSTLPITINNTPSLIIQFPSNYNLAWYKSNIFVNIDEYLVDVNSNKLILAANIPTASVIVSGNRLTITLSAISKTFPSNFRHWDVTVNNVFNPLDTTVNSYPVAQTTKPYSFILTNSDNTVLYRTYTNLNSYVSSALTTPLDANLSFNRGNAFVYINNKFAIDVYSDSTQTNNIVVRSGRYTQAFFSVKSNLNNYAVPSVTNVSLSDSLFKTSGNNFSVASAYNSPIGFYIGCTCGVTPGMYIINFTHTDSTFTNFTQMAPILVTLDTASKAMISYITSYNNANLSSSWVSLSLSEPNFDALTINWTATDNGFNDAGASVSNLNIPPMTTTPSFVTFSSKTTPNILGVQSFKAADPNLCFTWQNNVVSFNVSGPPVNMPKSVDLAASFKYYTADNDPYIKQKNVIKFTFSPPVYPAYLYCALTCSGNDYPADADVITPKSSNNECTQYYRSFVSSMNSMDFYYSNLKRSQQYKMKCLLQSTEVDLNKRTTYNVTLDSYTVTNGNVTTTNLYTTPVSPQTQCAQWKFNNTVNSTVANRFTDYCQSIFSAGGYPSNGCVTCAPWDLTYYAAGLPAPVAVCPNPKSIRFLQAATSSVDSSYLTICAFINPVCASDVNNNGKTYADTLNIFINNLLTTPFIKQNVNIDNIFVNSTGIVSYGSTCNNFSPIDVTKTITNSNLSNSTDSTLAVTLNFPGAADCYWKVSQATSAPAYSELTNCVDTFWCGRVTFGPNSTMSFATSRSFTPGATYQVYVGCSNDIGTQTNNTPRVITAASFTVPKVSVVPTVLPVINVTPSNTTNTTISSSSEYIRYTWTIILCIASLFF
jgi:hypothetical protein